MKYSQLIGVVISVLLIAICYMPWSYIPDKNIVVTGMHAEGTFFGKPGLLNIILTSVMFIMFAVPKVWSKRTNVFLAAINLAWSVRNYLILSTCFMGECPEKRIGLYLLMLFSVMLQLLTFFPNVKLKDE